MPLYRCLVAEGLTSLEQRSRIAREITRIHCETTGALPEFVHTFFSEDAKGQLPVGRKALVLGGIRAGRSREQKERLATGMRGAVATIAGIGEEAVLVATADIPARWVMEGGRVLPEPGDEEAWRAEQA
jgi:phenylpyruvate tautomerase PptA (4-oxalocrotonate tautomerase family)